jgi:pimeloyl-ACP methyl ester carboxylesterase
VKNNKNEKYAPYTNRCMQTEESQMNSKVVNTKFGSIEYSSIGKGTAIVFVHGGHSNCKETLCHKGFDLERYRLITPSRPGYGNTPLGNNRTPRQAADLIIELINRSINRKDSRLWYFSRWINSN